MYVYILKVLYVGLSLVRLAVELGIAVQIQNIEEVFFNPAPPPQGAFTPDANRANDLHVKSMQRRESQSCGAIRANGENRASWKIWTLADIRAALTNQELALAVT